MSFWCGIIFILTATFSLNVLYHNLFSNSPSESLFPQCIKESLYGSVSEEPLDYKHPRYPPDEIDPKNEYPIGDLLTTKSEFPYQVSQEKSTVKNHPGHPAETHHAKKLELLPAADPRQKSKQYSQAHPLETEFPQKPRLVIQADLPKHAGLLAIDPSENPGFLLTADSPKADLPEVELPQQDLIEADVSETGVANKARCITGDDFPRLLASLLRSDLPFCVPTIPLKEPENNLTAEQLEADPLVVPKETEQTGDNKSNDVLHDESTVETNPELPLAPVPGEPICRDDFQEPMAAEDELPRKMSKCQLEEELAETESVENREDQQFMEQLISTDKLENLSQLYESITATEKESHRIPLQSELIPVAQVVSPETPYYIDGDIVIVLVVHVMLVISVLVVSYKCIQCKQQCLRKDTDMEELLVTIGLISCIALALVTLLGATVLLLIRILLATFP